HGAFRQHLYYRLNVFPIGIPPLRERVDDIPVLVEYLVERYARKAGKSIRNIKKQTVALFQAYDWPGNVRELQNVIERAVVLCDGETFSIDESWLKGEPHQSSKGVARLLLPSSAYDRWLPQMTLRIETVSDGQTATLRLIGRIESESLDELRAEVRRHRLRLVLDLDEVTLVDVGVVSFLIACEAEG